MLRLRWFNGGMGVLHLAQGGLMLALSSDFSLPLTASFLEFDPAASKLSPTPETLVDLHIGPMVAAFLFLSAIAHFLVASPGVYQWYAGNLTKGINYARWVEYFFSASLMIVVIAMLVGIYDIASLILIFAVNATMILFGLMMEVHNQTTERTNWASFWFGSLAGAVPWIAIAIYLFGSGGDGGGPPGFVYGIFGSIFVFFNVFAVNMVLQYKEGRSVERLPLRGADLYRLEPGRKVGSRLAGVRGDVASSVGVLEVVLGTTGAPVGFPVSESPRPLGGVRVH